MKINKLANHSIIIEIAVRRRRKTICTGTDRETIHHGVVVEKDVPVRHPADLGKGRRQGLDGPGHTRWQRGRCSPRLGSGRNVSIKFSEVALLRLGERREIDKGLRLL